MAASEGGKAVLPCNRPPPPPAALMQAKVAAKAACQLQTSPWLHQRAAAVLRDPAALRAWALEMVPDTIAEAWSIAMICLVGGFAVSCIQVGGGRECEGVGG